MQILVLKRGSIYLYSLNAHSDFLPERRWKVEKRITVLQRNLTATTLAR
jgi:hypothetical protein